MHSSRLPETNSPKAAFCAAVDWGTSSFRLWLLSDDGEVLHERRSGEGMVRAADIGFEAVLDTHLAATGAPAAVPVIISGMAGARQGWREAPYVDTPASLSGLAEHTIPVQTSEIAVARIIPGIAQRDRSAPDVMRGEETQLLGLADQLPHGLVCMPGTHSKWVRLDGGAVTRFHTFMTGELYALVSSHSTLAQAVGDAPADCSDPVFSETIISSMTAPAALTGHLFSLRAAALLGETAHGATATRLSGLLIGTEMAGARAQFGGVRAVTLVASGTIGDLYQAALATAGYDVTRIDAEEAARMGLLRVAKQLWS